MDKFYRVMNFFNESKTIIGAGIVSVATVANEISIVISDGAPPEWWVKVIRISMILAAYFGGTGICHKASKKAEQAQA
jgi:hypothetical protein